MVEFDETSILLLIAIVVVAILAIPLLPRIPDVHPIFLRSQSEASKVRQDGESVIYSSSMGGMRNRLFGKEGKEIVTLVDLWDEAVAVGARYADGDESSVPISKWDAQAKAFGRGLLEIGLQNGDRVGIISKPSLLWLATEIGCLAAVLVVIGLPSASEVPLDEQLEMIRALRINALVIDEDHAEHASKFSACGIKQIVLLSTHNSVEQSVVSWTDVAQRGHDSTSNVNRRPSDPVNIITISSGTSAQHAVLTHKNRISSISAFSSSFIPSKKMSSADRYLTTMPCWDVTARTGMYAALLEGAEVCFGSGSPSMLPRECRAFRPTIVQTVGEAAASLCDVIKTLPKGLFSDFAVRRKVEILMGGCAVRDTIWDKLFLHGIQEMTGGHLRLIHISEGMIERDTLKYLVAILGCQITRSFTRPEAGGPITTTHPADYLGCDEYVEDEVHLGPPVTGLQLKLRRIIKEGRDSMEGIEDGADPIGEILIKGDMVASHYIVHSGEEKSCLDKEGWYDTGVVGQILVNGTLKLATL